MTHPANPATLVTWGGFAIGFAFGVVANRFNFCTMGAVADVVTMHDWRRMRMWLLAIAVAILGANLLHHWHLVDLDASIYTRPKLLWLSHLAGGLMFGIGMTLAGGCGSRTLVRIGNGSLKALVVLAFLSIAAYMTLRGLFAVWRVAALDRIAIDTAAHGVNAQDIATLAHAPAARVSIALAIAAALCLFGFKDRAFRTSLDHVLGGVLIGATVVAGWLLTGYFGYAENHDTLEMTYFATNSRAPESLTFVAPPGYLLELLVLWSDTSLSLTFGVACTLGVVAGSAVYALIARRFRWEGFTSVDDLRNHIVGALLMGCGGVTALGCTIGQGISGLSTLAAGSILTLAAIITGSALTMRWLYARM